MALKYKLTNKNNILYLSGKERTLILDKLGFPAIIQDDEKILPKTLLSLPKGFVTNEKYLVFFISSNDLLYEHDILSHWRYINNFCELYPYWIEYIQNILSNKSFGFDMIMQYLIYSYQTHLIKNPQEISKYIVELLENNEKINIDEDVRKWGATISPLLYLRKDETSEKVLLTALETHIQNGGKYMDFLFFIEDNKNLPNKVITWFCNHNQYIDIFYKNGYVKSLIANQKYIREYIAEYINDANMLMFIYKLYINTPIIYNMIPDYSSSYFFNYDELLEIHKVYDTILNNVFKQKYNINEVLIKLFIENKKELHVNIINIITDYLDNIDNVGNLILLRNYFKSYLSKQKYSDYDLVLWSINHRISLLSV